MCKLRLLNRVKEQEEYLQCGGSPQLLMSRDFHLAYSHNSIFVFVVKLSFFSDLNFRAQITKRGLCNKASEKLCPSPGKKSGMVLWLIEQQFCNEYSDSSFLGSTSVEALRFY